MIEKISPGFSVSDASYPLISASPGKLRIAFNESRGRPISVDFTDVPAFFWLEGRLAELQPDEPWDGACVLLDSDLLRAHSPGQTMHSSPQVTHVRLNFNAWGTLDVLCSGFVVSAE